jgi:hypothetical protein
MAQLFCGCLQMQFMDKKEESSRSAGIDYNAASDQTAKNPNPRANENIRVRTEVPGTESADIEDEVGSEITDGEDA